MTGDTLYTWEEIRKHNTDKDCWVVLYGNVLNVTDFLNRHPGGLDPINDLGGYDITNQFEAIGHSAKAEATYKKYIIGKVDPTSKQPAVVRKAVTKPDVPLSEFRLSEKSLLQMLAPYLIGGVALLAVVSYFF